MMKYPGCSNYRRKVLFVCLLFVQRSGTVQHNGCEHPEAQLTELQSDYRQYRERGSLRPTQSCWDLHSSNPRVHFWMLSSLSKTWRRGHFSQQMETTASWPRDWPVGRRGFAEVPATVPVFRAGLLNWSGYHHSVPPNGRCDANMNLGNKSLILKSALKSWLTITYIRASPFNTLLIS